jgi:hypothetical protein
VVNETLTMYGITSDTLDGDATMGPVNERTTAEYKGYLQTITGAAMPGSDLDTLTLTLIDASTQTIINNRNAQNVLNTNGVTIGQDGLITWTIDPADNPIHDDRLEVELHRAIFIATWNGGAGEMTHVVDLWVTNVDTLV